jgi:hypothetical protein
MFFLLSATTATRKKQPPRTGRDKTPLITTLLQTPMTAHCYVVPRLDCRPGIAPPHHARHSAPPPCHHDRPREAEKLCALTPYHIIGHDFIKRHGDAIASPGSDQRSMRIAAPIWSSKPGQSSHCQHEAVKPSPTNYAGAQASPLIVTPADEAVERNGEGAGREKMTHNCTNIKIVYFFEFMRQKSLVLH